MDDMPNRRTVVGAVLGTFVAGTAGCLGGGDSGSAEDWLDNANNNDGTADQTGQQEVTVEVGVGDGLSFEPASVQVTTGTTVLWVWTGFGGSHNVVEEDGAFESELKAAEGETFSHTFSEAGVYRYLCTPHQTQGMLGVVEVVDE